MKEIVNRVLLAGNKFMPEMFFWQSGLTYTASGLFTKNKQKNTKVQRNRRFKIYLSKRTG